MRELNPKIVECARALVASWPEMTTEQVAHVAEVLRNVSPGGDRP